ncbi:putative quinol monooxygenase [Pedobacter sp. AW1-32]|uniref:putative quinol monooxygenase n=1 Tax=Pedobacter sp. AW1-32 TaxID=3383026 RepID=UPI003FF052EB
MKFLIYSSTLVCILALATFFIAAKKPAEPQKVRLSRLVIDAAQLDRYKSILKEEIEASMAKEPGVLALYAVFEKAQPTHLTILEMYATEEAYKAHIQTPHFLKYKNGTLNMVKELELIDTEPLIPNLKIK